MKKFMLLGVALLALIAYIAPAAHATVPSNNQQSYMDYSPGTPASNPSLPSIQAGLTTSQGQWWATEGQPNRTFHRLTVRDTSGCEISIGHGTSPNQVVDLYVGGIGAASTQEVVYPFGLSYGGSSTCIWWKRTTGCEPNVGQQVLNFIY